MSDNSNKSKKKLTETEYYDKFYWPMTESNVPISYKQSVKEMLLEYLKLEYYDTSNTNQRELIIIEKYKKELLRKLNERM